MGEIQVYVCEVCGRKYIKNKRWTSSHTCCRKCLIDRKNKLERERRANERNEKKEVKKDSNLLNEINAKALAEGMTYGEYQAMLFLQKKGVRS
jgi:hydrogenase maturation factor HypF (carbamoyltransferase family)